jgi:hypothetical protein
LAAVKGKKALAELAQQSDIHPELYCPANGPASKRGSQVVWLGESQLFVATIGQRD